MLSADSSYKRIAKNTLMLYLRMFVTLLVGLYTSRVVLNVLGISDYGLYNVVGGLVSVMTLLNGAMVSASQRFFSFELGVADSVRSHKVFCTSLTIHVIIALLFILVAETFGLWFLNSQLNIDEGRIVAANIVYQCSVLGCAISMMGVPYSSSIISHERMDVFAYVSIYNVIVKLVLVLSLTVITYDRLIAYAFFILGLSLTVQLINYCYCKYHFEECHYEFLIEKGMLREMSSFAGWTILGEMGFSFKDQLSNILLNIFLGTTVNAARGVAATVNGVVNTFSSNFTMAMKPQITKQYASGDIKESSMLVFAGARYSFFLMSIIAIPILINIDYLLLIWLKIVPEYTSSFVIITIACSLIYTLTQPITTAIQATGRIKWFQIGVCFIMMSELPIAYIILKNGGKPYEAMYPAIFTSTLALFYRFFILKKMIPTYCWKVYLSNVLFRCLVVFSLVFILVYYVKSFLSENFMNLLVIILVSVLISFFFIYIFGITRVERNYINNELSKLVIKNRKRYEKE